MPRGESTGTVWVVAALLSSEYSETCLWQEQVAGTLPSTDSGSPLPDLVDVVVVGAGMCGLSAATAVARLGRSVVVIDREPLGWGASSRNGGMVIPELKAGPAALTAKYGEVGRRMYHEVNLAFDHVESVIAGTADAGPIDCDYVRSGLLYLAHSRRHVGELRAMAAEHGGELGEDVRFVARRDLAAEVGSDAFAAGLVMERTGAVHPARFHRGLARHALSAGVLVHDRTAVTSIARNGDRHRIDTTRGAVFARHVLVATNAYADASVPDLRRRVLPVSSYMIATEVLPEDLAASVSPTGRMMFDSRNFLNYWRLTPDRRMAFGGRRSLDPVDVVESRDFLYDRMLDIHPQLRGTAVQYAWGGSVAVTLDRLPHVGRIDGAWYATGCNGSGVALNTWLGHRMGLSMLGEAPVPAVAEVPHRPIPLSSWRNVYLPVVSRWFAFEDSR
ncbi:MAG: FAD-binding oxidoreductase [Microthrixaceae bacterium]|nr:FAD-binding oxidoreductase [Microthrixaceae bacterium]